LKPVLPGLGLAILLIALAQPDGAPRTTSALRRRWVVQQIVALLVERLETSNRRVTRVIWAGAARPFFAAGDYAVASRTDSGARKPKRSIHSPGMPAPGDHPLASPTDYIPVER